jgi:hypothetical protein
MAYIHKTTANSLYKGELAATAIKKSAKDILDIIKFTHKSTNNNQSIMNQ